MKMIHQTARYLEQVATWPAAGRGILAHHDAESVVVVAQVSPDGRPGEASATWVGSSDPVTPGLDTRPLELVLAPKTP